MTDRPKRRGGRREPPGGAPVKGNVRLVCYVQPATRAVIDAEVARTGETLGQVVDRLIGSVIGSEPQPAAKRGNEQRD